MQVDCINEPLLVLRIDCEDGTKHVHRINFSELAAFKRIPAVGDKVSVTFFTGSFHASLSEAIVNLADEGPGGYGSTAMVWIWLAALELSLRRKISETLALGLTNKQTELWTRDLGVLLDWQLGQGIATTFSRLEPGDLGWVDQLYFVEKTTVHHRAWNRQGETNKLQDATIARNGIYFAALGGQGQYWPLLVLR